MSQTETHASSRHIELVAAYVSNNNVTVDALPGLIGNIYVALEQLTVAKPVPEPAGRKPAVPITKSITQDFIICLEDGRRFKSLKRHLTTQYGLTPEAYRAKWGLASDYPMVAPSYAAARSTLAKSMGLGRKRKELASPPEAPAPRKKIYLKFS